MAKGKKSVVSSEKARSMEDIEKDPRFAHTARDPRFKPNYKQKKVKIDSRFKSMLQDKEFNIKFLDKRGRPINSSTKEDLRRLYQYESDSEEEEDSSEEEKSEAEESDREESSGREEEQDENDDDDDDAESSETEGEREASEEREGGEEDEEAEEDADSSISKGESSDDDFPDLTAEDAPDYARGVGVLESSDDEQAGEDEDDVEEEEEEEGILDHNWNEPDHNAPEAEEITSRLALCNMDWDRIKARDLYVLFTSFVPQDGAVQSVTIYPSELGREKMAEEEKLGPREFREKVDKGDDSHIGKLNHAKLRQYQLNRLAYYYAVIVCDSKETANKLYEECDSMEYEKSACRVDLRFIPEGMTFEETPKDSCTGVSDLSKFKPSTFTTTALCQAKVQVTWDETSIERLTKTMQKKFTEEDLGSNKFDELIASSSEDSSEEETNSKRPGKKKNKKDVKTYRKLLGLEDDKAVEEKDGDSQTSGEESEQDEDEMLFSAKIGSGSEDEEEGVHSPLAEGDSENEEEQKLDTAKTKSRKTEKMKKKDKKNSKEKQNGHSQSSDVSADEEEVEGEMQYTWQPSANPKILKTQARKKLTPWEEYQQKKKDKKKEKKRERKQQRLRQQGIEDTTDLGFDDEFFNDEPTEEPTKKKKKKERKKKRQQEENKEESEADRKDRASLALLMKEEDNDHNHFSLMQIMKEESEGRKKKGKKRKQAEAEAMDSFEMKLDHSRFGSLYTDPNMHIDPNAPEFKKTKGMMTLMGEVSKKRKAAHNAL